MMRNKIDLSSDEDLSIALMNLISIEEHMYFSGMKSGDEKYFDMLKDIRELRKKLLKKMVKSSEAEEWCISKHLLGASMRLIEVGNKCKEKKEAHSMFKDAFELYSMFWGINLGLIKGRKIKKRWKSKLSSIVKKIIDCCKE
jgi:hypothetical protein